MINPSKRAVRVGDNIGAALFTGTDKIRSGFGNGDCLYLDFGSGVFAVADAAERFPEASRNLLTRMAKRVTEKKGPINDRLLEDIVRRLWAEQKYLEKTTLSCVTLESRNNERIVHIAQGGDSMVVLADTANGRRYFQTSVDMNFAGRGLTPPEVVTYRLKKKTDRIILASDGLQDFNRAINGSGRGDLPDLFFKKQVDPVMAAMDAVYRKRQKGREFDDMGIIVIDPFKPCAYGGEKIIIGGTSPAQEKEYTRSVATGNHRTEWIEAAEWCRQAKRFAAAGIYADTC